MDATSPRRIVATSGPTATLEEVDILRELDTRPARSPDYETQNRALAALAEEMAVNPRNMLQRLVEVAVDLCQADTSGISLLEGDVFRWEAVAGVFAAARNGTMPRDASPCGVVIDRDAIQLMELPDRCFPALLAEPRFVEALLFPFVRVAALAARRRGPRKQPPQGRIRGHLESRVAQPLRGHHQRRFDAGTPYRPV